jgi:hypothetical protein
MTDSPEFEFDDDVGAAWDRVRAVWQRVLLDDEDLDAMTDALDALDAALKKC